MRRKHLVRTVGRDHGIESHRRGWARPFLALAVALFSALAVVQPAAAQTLTPNPDFAGACSTKLALVLDGSDSIENPNGAVGVMRSEALNLLTSLIGTGTEVAIVEFAVTADTPVGYTPVTQSNIDTVFAPYFSDTGPGFGGRRYFDGTLGPSTNWEAAFNQVDALAVPDLVVMVTDGDPNTVGSGPGGNAFGAAVAPAAAVANTVKGEGSHILALGLGGFVTQANLREITDGPQSTFLQLGTDTAGTADIFGGNFSNLSAAYSTIPGSVCPPVNTAPTISPIADQTVDEGQTISIPISSMDLDGDGLTLSGLVPSFCSLIDGGDGTGSIDCSPGFLDSGSYFMSATSTDDGDPSMQSSSFFVLDVVEINDPPEVDAGPNAEITVPDPAQLNGSATDDGIPASRGSLTYQWSVVSGNGNVIFADDTSPTSTAVFEGGGDFILRLTASDGQLTSSDEVTITVNNPLGCTVFGTNGPDDLVGTNGPDVICGFAGNDDIEALLGDDTVFGGSGNDKMVGGGGNDTMSSPSGTNTFNGQGGNDMITGGGGPDTIDGGGGADMILGLAGNDVLRGGSGRDTITGGSGDDEIRGGGGNDRLRDAAGDDMLFGDGGKDSLRDLVGTNTLDGGAGADRCTDAGGTSDC